MIKRAGVKQSNWEGFMCNIARVLTLTTMLLAICWGGRSACGDEIHLKGGGILKGRIVSQKGDFVRIEIRPGFITGIKKSDIKLIKKTKSPIEVYREKLAKLAKGDRDAKLQLATWCHKNMLRKQAVELLREVLSGAPENERALVLARQLGYRVHKGRLMKLEEYARLNGWIRYKNTWLPPKFAYKRGIAELKKERQEILKDLGKAKASLESYTTRLAKAREVQGRVSTKLREAKTNLQNQERRVASLKATMDSKHEQYVRLGDLASEVAYDNAKTNYYNAQRKLKGIQSTYGELYRYSVKVARFITEARLAIPRLGSSISRNQELLPVLRRRQQALQQKLDALAGGHNPKGQGQPAEVQKAKLAVLERAICRVLVRTGKGKWFSGTGFLFDKRGYIVTNSHVVKDAAECWLVWDPSISARLERVSVVGKFSPKMLDLAILRSGIALQKGIRPLELASADVIAKGAAVRVLGCPDVPLKSSPLGRPARSLRRIILTTGVVSAVHKDDRGGLLWLQTDAAINPGNSGGPMIDWSSQKVIGVVTYKASRAEGQGFAIPSSRVRKMASLFVGAHK